MLFDINKDGKVNINDLLALAEDSNFRAPLVRVLAYQVVASETKADDDAVLLLADIFEQAKNVVEAGTKPSIGNYIDDAIALFDEVRDGVNETSKAFPIFDAAYKGVRATLLSLRDGFADGSLSSAEITTVASTLISGLFSMVPLFGK